MDLSIPERINASPTRSVRDRRDWTSATPKFVEICGMAANLADAHIGLLPKLPQSRRKAARQLPRGGSLRSILTGCGTPFLTPHFSLLISHYSFLIDKNRPAVCRAVFIISSSRCRGAGPAPEDRSPDGPAAWQRTARSWTGRNRRQSHRQGPRPPVRGRRCSDR